MKETKKTPATPASSSDESPVLALMREYKVPMTREEFLNLNYMGNVPDEIPPEDEEDFPPQFRLNPEEEEDGDEGTNKTASTRRLCHITTPEIAEKIQREGWKAEGQVKWHYYAPQGRDGIYFYPEGSPFLSQYAYYLADKLKTKQLSMLTVTIPDGTGVETTSQEDGTFVPMDEVGVIKIERVDNYGYEVGNGWSKKAAPDFGYTDYNEEQEQDLDQIDYELDGDGSSYQIEAKYDYGDGEVKTVGRIICTINGKTVVVSTNAIANKWRGTGLGQLLYDQAIAEAKNKGFVRFQSDADLTNDAHAAWGRLQRRYPVTQDRNTAGYSIDLTKATPKAKAMHASAKYAKLNEK